jgi:YfiH family protein
MIINPLFKFKHFTTTKPRGNMKDCGARELFLFCAQVNPKKLVLAEQIHSNTVKIAAKNDGGKILEDCDGLITDELDLALGIFTADCMPVLLASKDGRVRAAVHCGWKGLAAGILENALGIFAKEFGIAAKDICVYIAPHIKECCYEVGRNFENIFNVKLKNLKLNMSEIALGKLKKSGVENIVISGECTFCKDGLFFSYRKNKTQERQLTAVL